MSFDQAPNNPFTVLSSPLLLPARPGKPLTTGAGNTLDDGTGSMVVAGNLVVDGQVTALGGFGSSAASSGRITRRYAALGFTDAVWDMFAVASPVSITPTSQQVYGTLMGFYGGDVVTNIWVCVSTAAVGAGPTGIFVGLYDTSGNLLAQSANVAAAGSTPAWTNGTNRFTLVPLTAPFTIPTDGGYYFAFLQNGAFATTQPTFKGGSVSGVEDTPFGANPVMCVKQAARATLANPAVLVGDTSNMWFGFS